LKNITPLILAFNEAPNIRRTLERLCWAEEIVVVDSFSTDETLEIVKSFPQARIVQRKFDSFAGQCNFGLEKVKTNWVLSLDADYVLSEELVDEIRRLDGGGNAAGYQVRFRYCIQGRPLRGSLYPPRTVLYRRDRASYHNEGHGHRVQIEGPVRMLSGWIDHDDRKPLERWFGEQVKYSGREARYLLETSNTELKMADRIRKKIILAPALVFFYTLLGKGLILNGWPGWFYVFQRTFVEILRSLRLIEEKLKREGKKSKCDVTTEATK
jgi:glycosyltransferase involved in cell wall biosynthesis